MPKVIISAWRRVLILPLLGTGVLTVLLDLVLFHTTSGRVVFAAVMFLGVGLGTDLLRGAMVAQFTDTHLLLHGYSVPYNLIRALVAQALFAVSSADPLIARSALPRFGARHWLVYSGRGNRSYADHLADADPLIQPQLRRLVESGQQLSVVPVTALLAMDPRFTRELLTRVPGVHLAAELLPFTPLRQYRRAPMTAERRLVIAAALLGPLVLIGLTWLVTRIR